MFFFELSNVYRRALTIIPNAGNGPSSQSAMDYSNNIGYMSTFINDNIAYYCTYSYGKINFKEMHAFLVKVP